VLNPILEWQQQSISGANSSYHHWHSATKCAFDNNPLFPSTSYCHTAFDTILSKICPNHMFDKMFVLPDCVNHEHVILDIAILSVYLWGLPQMCGLPLLITKCLPVVECWNQNYLKTECVMSYRLMLLTIKRPNGFV